MSLELDLQKRSGNACELCTSLDRLAIYEVKPTLTGGGGVDGSILACELCIKQIENPETTDVNHWRCLNDSMWSEFRAVLIKDLKVKGSSMVAKQGTAVRRISLDHENPKYIEGKVGPTQIVIITDYVKKMSEKE